MHHPLTAALPRLLALALTLFALCALSIASADDKQRDRNKDKLPAPGAIYEVELPPEAVPNYLERVVDFMWLEGGAVFKDRFTARMYPRQPTVGTFTRFNLRIQRTRDEVGRTPPNPTRVEVTLRRTDGKGQIKRDLPNPGPAASFDYEFERPGEYIASIVTFYSETESYTLTMRFNVNPRSPADQPKKKPN
jgi:hypothetical protein